MNRIDNRAKGRVEGFTQPLGALATVVGKPLGQYGEARNIGEQQNSVEWRFERADGCRGELLDHQIGYIAGQGAGAQSHPGSRIGM
ncbi:MAG: hypothetical protein OHK0022_14140 [Roseiflexaceae bacterium]